MCYLNFLKEASQGLGCNLGSLPVLVSTGYFSLKWHLDIVG